MKKIMQNKFDFDGNCLPACIASLLEIDLDGIPAFVQIAEKNHDNWFEIMREWLVENYKIYSIMLENDIESYPVYHIALGKAQRGYYHAVVHMGDKLYHDPHPDLSGLLEVKRRIYFLPMDMEMIKF